MTSSPLYALASFFVVHLSCIFSKHYFYIYLSSSDLQIFLLKLSANFLLSNYDVINFNNDVTNLFIDLESVGNKSSGVGEAYVQEPFIYSEQDLSES